MTIQEFLELGEMEKVCTIMQSGCLIAQRLEADTRVFLYRIGSFYVSACYLLSGDLKEITAYVDIDQTVPYLRKYLVSIHPAERQYDTPEI